MLAIVEKSGLIPLLIIVLCAPAWADLKISIGGGSSKISISSDGKVQVGKAKFDALPPEVRVLERVANGESLEKAMENETKARVGQAEELARLPQLQNAFENNVFEKLRNVVGNDAVDAFEVANLPNQIAKTAPDVAFQMAKAIAEGKNPAEAAAGVPLHAALEQAKQYYQGKGKPLPKSVKILMVRNFSTEIINNARYVVDDFGGNVPAILNKINETLDGVHAVAVDNIIVFSSKPEDNDIFFWAHELQHTAQYASLGIKGFADEYTANYKKLENEADAVARATHANAEAIIVLLSSVSALNDDT